MSLDNLKRIRTYAYLIVTLTLAFWLGLVLPWVMFFVWGLLMAAWEQPTHHWYRSVFKKWGWSQYFWDHTVAWFKVTKLWGKEIPWDDAFHLSKTMQILLISFIPLSTTDDWTWYYTLAAGWVTTESFNLFYNYLLDTDKT